MERQLPDQSLDNFLNRVETRKVAFRYDAMCRPRTFLLCDPKCISHKGRNALCRDDLRRHLGERPYSRYDIDDLKSRGPFWALTHF